MEIIKVDDINKYIKEYISQYILQYMNNFIKQNNINEEYISITIY